MFQGGTFTFEVVGGRFEVYRVLVARKSRALEAMMENGMKESLKGVAPLEDTDVPTFARFAEFIISGDYTPAEPEQASLSPRCGSDQSSEQHEEVEQDVNANEVLQSPHSPPSEDNKENEDDDFGFNSFRSKKGKNRSVLKSRKKSYLWGMEDDVSQPPSPQSPAKPHNLLSPTDDVIIKQPLPTSSMFVPNGNWSLDYLPLLLSHAQLYVFADTYEIQDLQNLSARRLDEALGVFEFDSTCPTNIAELLKYVYDNTPERESKTDVLRTIVTNFVARNINSLIHSGSFRELIRNGGSIALEVLTKVTCCL